MEAGGAQTLSATDVLWAIACVVVCCAVILAVVWVKLARMRMDHELALRAAEEGHDLTAYFADQRRAGLRWMLWAGVLCPAIGAAMAVADAVAWPKVAGTDQEATFVQGLFLDLALLLAGPVLLGMHRIFMRQEKVAPQESGGGNSQVGTT